VSSTLTTQRPRAYAVRYFRTVLVVAVYHLLGWHDEAQAQERANPMSNQYVEQFAHVEARAFGGLAEGLLGRLWLSIALRGL
jgi:hypothetical protein